LNEFNVHATSPQGRRLRCQYCTREYQKNYRKKHPDRVAAHERSKNLRKYYNLHPEQYEVLKEWSNGGCAICGAKNGREGYRLFVDHDHATGKVRALLCNDCNLGLGAFKDRVDLLKIAIAYLEYFKV
jgi:Recombination endonuclease VII